MRGYAYPLYLGGLRSRSQIKIMQHQFLYSCSSITFLSFWGWVMICEGSGWQQHNAHSSLQVAWNFLEPARYLEPVLCYKGICSCNVSPGSRLAAALSSLFVRPSWLVMNLLISVSLFPFPFFLGSLRHFIWNGWKFFWSALCCFSYKWSHASCMDFLAFPLTFPVNISVI